MYNFLLNVERNRTYMDRKFLQWRLLGDDREEMNQAKLPTSSAAEVIIIQVNR